MRAGNDTDTVAAVAGALLGARWGCSGIPLQWQQEVHGWPGLTAPGLVGLAVRTARGGTDASQGWPSAPRMPDSAHPAFAVPHPRDPGVALGDLTLAQGTKPVPVDAVVSLCPVGIDPVIPGTDVEHVRVWLMDVQGDKPRLRSGPGRPSGAAAASRRKTGPARLPRRQSRTPAVAALYRHLAAGADATTALHELREVLHTGWALSHHPEMQEAVHELTAGYTAAGRWAAERAVTGPGAAPGQRREQLNLGLTDHVEPVQPVKFVERQDGGVQGSRDDAGPGAGRHAGHHGRQAARRRAAAGRGEHPVGLLHRRGHHPGVGSRPDARRLSPAVVVWHAYSRWMALQGLEADRMRRRWDHGEQVWPDGWLARVPALAERRGSAPSTVTALSEIEHGTPTASRGCHALTRTLPVAVIAAADGLEASYRLAQEIAALTHGNRAAQSATAHAVALIGQSLAHTENSASDPRAGVREALRNGVRSLVKTDDYLTT